MNDIFFTSFIEEIIIWLYFFVCSCSQKSNISNLPTASLCCAGSITYKYIGRIQNMKVIIYRPQFENVHFLWVNNASTSFFTHFYSINFIYTAYFAWNYFIFTSYMKYFCLWSISIVTAVWGHSQMTSQHWTTNGNLKSWRKLMRRDQGSSEMMMNDEKCNDLRESIQNRL